MLVAGFTFKRAMDSFAERDDWEGKALLGSYSSAQAGMLRRRKRPVAGFISPGRSA